MDKRKTISVIIPVLQEQDIINRTISRLFEMDSTVEIVVSDGSAAGSTLNVITDQRVIKVQSPKGRARQLNRGAAKSSGEILFFLHADTTPPPGAFETIRSFAASNPGMAGAFTLKIENPLVRYRLIEYGAKCRTLMTGISYGDQGLFLTRDLFDKLGGYCEIPLMEDMEIGRRLKKNHRGTKVLYNNVWTSSRKWESEGAVYCTLRNWSLAILFSLGVSAKRLVRIYYRDWEETQTEKNG